MSKTLELPDATYEIIAARAAEIGITPAELVEREFVTGELPKPLSLYEKLKPFIGCVPGKGEDLSGNHSKIFADHLEKQHREGRT